MSALSPAPGPATAPKIYTVLCDTGSATLSAQAVSAIAQAASAFKPSGARAVAVSAHTDTTGTPEFNLQLSQQRAAAVQAELERDGVPAERPRLLQEAERRLPSLPALGVGFVGAPCN